MAKKPDPDINDHIDALHPTPTMNDARAIQRKIMQPDMPAPMEQTGEQRLSNQIRKAGTIIGNARKGYNDIMTSLGRKP